MLSVQVIIYCSLTSVSPQSFLFKRNTVTRKGNDYMMGPNIDTNAKDGVEMLKEGGVPGKIAMKGMEALQAFKDYKIKENKILQGGVGDKKKKTLKRKISQKLPEKCRGDNVCMDFLKCIKCAKHWKRKMKKKHLGIKLK
jgi:hypothetical protein